MYYQELKRFLTRVPSVVRMTVYVTALRLIICISDLMWSDPDDVDNWAVSPRGAGWLFGGNVTREVSSVVYLLAPLINLSCSSAMLTICN